jgi:hypothetical protein
VARDEICRIGRSLFSRGYVHGTTGNISVRLDDGYLLTPIDACLGELDPDRLSRLDAGGHPLAGPRASKTATLHRRIYQCDPSATSVTGWARTSGTPHRQVPWPCVRSSRRRRCCGIGPRPPPYRPRPSKTYAQDSAPVGDVFLCTDGRVTPGVASQVEGDIDDHVLLTADQSPATHLEEDGADLDTVPIGSGLSVSQE